LNTTEEYKNKHLEKMRGPEMDLNYLDKTSKVVPMLVKLHDSHTLYDLARDKKPMAQQELSDAVAELIGMETSERERELIADVLISLVRQAERDLKLALSTKLSLMADIPLRLALYIANEDIEIAAPMLVNSLTLGDMDLLYILQSKPASYWRVIANRASMSPHLISALVQTKDISTVKTLLQNNTIILPETSMPVIIKMAEHSESLAAPLVLRPEINGDIAARIYNFVGHELKKVIAAKFDMPTDTLIETIEETILEFQSIAASEFTPSKSLLAATKRQHEKELLSVNMMLSNLRRGQIQTFIAQFSVINNLAPVIVEEMLTLPKGNGVAILSKAYDIPKADFVSVFLLTNRMREKGRMVDVNDMHRAVNYFNKVTKCSAEAIISAAKSKKRI